SPREQKKSATFKKNVEIAACRKCLPWPGVFIAASPPSLLLLFFDQHPPENLPHGRLGQFGAELVKSGNLVSRQALPAVGIQFLLRDPLPFLEDDKRFHGFPPIGIRNTDDGRLLNRRVFVQH